MTSSSLSRLRRIMLSTYSRYALSDGTRPAEVCGCSRYPSSSRSAISLRMVALERFRPERRLIDPRADRRGGEHILVDDRLENPQFPRVQLHRAHLLSPLLALTPIEC